MPQDIIVNGMLWNRVASIDVLGENGESVRYYSQGAYYTPLIDEEGNLSWTPVREDMPEVPIANIRGPQGAGGIKKIVDFYISASQWKENSNSEDEYKLYYDFSDKDISEDILLLMVLSDECLEKACCCGLCPTIVSYDGYARLKCTERPETAIKGTCYLIDDTIMAGGGGSGGSPVAEMFTGNTSDTTPTDVANAMTEGKTILLSHTDSTYGIIFFANFTLATIAGIIAASVTFEFNGMLLNASIAGDLENNTWDFSSVQLARVEDIPEEKFVTAVDLSRYDNGVIVETFSDGSTLTHNLTFDNDGKVTKIIGSDGNKTVLIW